MFRTRFIFLASTLFTLSFTLPTVASSARVPTALAERDLVVPKRTIRVDGGPRWVFPEGQFVFRVQDGPGDPAWFNAGATFGISADFHLGVVLPLQMAPGDPDMHDPRVHLLYQFINGAADIGVFFQANVPIEGQIGTTVGFPMQFHLTNSVRFDTGPFLHVWFHEGDPNNPNDDDDLGTDFSAPFELPINVSRQLFLGPEAGIVTHNRWEDVAVPVGFFVGYTMTSGGGTLGDLSFRIRDHNARDFNNQVDLIFAADLFFDI
jgi:hypothetical protein